MRFSHYFGETLRELPSEANAVGHSHLLRAAYLRSLPDGHTLELAFCRKSIDKIGSHFQRALENRNGQEFRVLPPSATWNRNLGSTSFQKMLTLAEREIHSYRQFPLLLYHFPTLSQDKHQSQTNPLHLRATTSLECISLNTDHTNAEDSYFSYRNLLLSLCQSFALPISLTKPVRHPGERRHSLIYPTAVGDGIVLECPHCSYADLLQFAQQKKAPHGGGSPLPLEKVSTPGTDTIASLAALLDIPEAKTAKAIFSIATFPESTRFEECLVLSIVRGDMELNERKLQKAIGALATRPARDDEILSVGAVPGFASPIGLEGLLTVADDLIIKSPNLVAGANERDFHYQNVNLGRDYQADVIADIVQTAEGDPCPNCGHALQSRQGFVVGQSVQLPSGDRAPIEIKYMDQNGLQQIAYISLHSIDLHSILAAIAEENHDDFGLRMPPSVSPFHAHLIRLKGDEDQGNTLYRQLRTSGYDVLYDDRDERPGVKFNDADLIGIPIRLTIGRRSLESGGVELKLRQERESQIIPLGDVVDELRGDPEEDHSPA